MSDSAPLNISFMIVVALLYSALILGAVWANNRLTPTNRWPVRFLRFFIGGYLLLMGMLALDQYFADFRGTPPHIAFAVIVAFLGASAISFHPVTLRWVREFPQRWLIGLQSFRVIIEIQLYFLFTAGFLPKAMTFEGQNFDILVGLSAPLVAWMVHRAHRQKLDARKLVTAWNILGMLMITNILVRGILSMPTKFQIFTDKPDSIGMTFFPWIWLPTFVIPFAYMLHILSLRREWAFRKDEHKQRLDSDLGNAAAIR